MARPIIDVEALRPLWPGHATATGAISHAQTGGHTLDCNAAVLAVRCDWTNVAFQLASGTALSLAIRGTAVWVSHPSDPRGSGGATTLPAAEDIIGLRWPRGKRSTWNRGSLLRGVIGRVLCRVFQVDDLTFVYFDATYILLFRAIKNVSTGEQMLYWEETE